MKGTIKFIDLFAGIGGTRCGLGFPCQSFSGGGKDWHGNTWYFVF